MTNGQATRRYFSIIIPAGAVILGASLALDWADDNSVLAGPGRYAGAIVPIAALLSVFWAHWRYMSEIDEFLRSIQIKALFVALTAVMTIATGWGYLEFYADAPPLSIFWLNPLYWLAYSAGAVIFNIRYGATN